VLRWQAIAAVATAVAIASLVLYMRRPAPSAPVVRFKLPAAAPAVGSTTQPAVSPDGRVVAYADLAVAGGITVRWIDRDAPELIAGTERARDIAFSPDGETLAWAGRDRTIVLWNALILHARWDKMVADRGLAVLAIGAAIVTNRVTVENARAVTAGQGGDWFRDNFLPGGLLGRKPGYNVDSWVEWAADIASQAGRDVEHAKRSVRNALTTIEITTRNLGLRELENYRKRFAGTVSDEDAIAVVNAAPPNAITEAQKWAQDCLNTFLQKSASDYWFVKLHIALDGGPEAVSGHEYLAEVARPLAPLVRAGKVDGESIVGACVAFASERHAETVEGGGDGAADARDGARQRARGLQRTNGVRLVVNRVDADRARRILEPLLKV
jgi:hypothetical protein